MKAYGSLEEQLRAFLTSTVDGGDLLCIPAALQIGKQPPAQSCEEVAGWSPYPAPLGWPASGLVTILMTLSLLLR